MLTNNTAPYIIANMTLKFLTLMPAYNALCGRFSTNEARKMTKSKTLCHVALCAPLALYLT